MFQQILLAWDGSELARRAFDIAIDLTRRYDADLVAVSVAYSPAHAETDADREESADAARRYLTSTFGEVADRAERAGVSVRQEIIEGDAPTRVLLSYAKARGFDLIVCGHHHSRRAGRLLLRGVAHELMEATDIPLLLISEQER
jgi:nucleotide-binding universal stress UspA family protein